MTGSCDESSRPVDPAAPPAPSPGCRSGISPTVKSLLSDRSRTLLPGVRRGMSTLHPKAAQPLTGNEFEQFCAVGVSSTEGPPESTRQPPFTPQVSPLAVENLPRLGGPAARPRRLPAMVDATSPTQPPTAARPHRTHPPRRHLRRRVRVAARQGVPETLAYLEAENACTEARTAHLGDLREQIFERDQGRAPRRPTCRCPPGSAATGTTAAPTRASSTARAAAAPLATPTTGPRRRSTPTSRARRGGAPRRQRAGRGARLLLARRRLGQPRRHAARVQHRHRRQRALPAAGQGPGAPGSCCPTRCPAPWAAPPGTATGTTLFYTTVDEAWRPDKVWRHVLGTTRRGRRGRAPRGPTSGSGPGSAGPAATGSW